MYISAVIHLRTKDVFGEKLNMHESLGVIFDVLFQRAIRIRVIVYSWVNIRDLLAGGRHQTSQFEAK